MPDSQQRTRATAYGPALDGPLTKFKRTPKEAEEMREKKAEEAEHERQKKNYLEAYAKAVKELSDKYEADLIEYERKMEEYKDYQDEVRRFGAPTNKRKIRNPPKPPKKIDIRKVKVPSNPSLYSNKFLEGGRRTRRRHRKSRSTRRR
jgi:hypothetical protein